MHTELPAHYLLQHRPGWHKTGRVDDLQAAALDMLDDETGDGPTTRAEMLTAAEARLFDSINGGPVIQSVEFTDGIRYMVSSEWVEVDLSDWFYPGQLDGRKGRARFSVSADMREITGVEILEEGV